MIVLDKDTKKKLEVLFDNAKGKQKRILFSMLFDVCTLKLKGGDCLKNEYMIPYLNDQYYILKKEEEDWQKKTSINRIFHAVTEEN